MVASGNAPVHKCTGGLPESTGELLEIQEVKQLSDLFLRTIEIGTFYKKTVFSVSLRINIDLSSCYNCFT